MKAMIFAAGIGSRLKPWTDHHPKALAEVGGVPVLGRVLESLRSAGVTEAVVNVHHFPEQIVAYLQSHDHGVTVHVSDESPLLLDTGGGLLLALKRFPQFTETGMLLHNADILTDAPLKALAHDRESKGAVASLLVKQRDTRRYLMFDQTRRMTGWHDLQTGKCKPQGAVYNADDTLLRAFGGVHAVDGGRIVQLLEEYNSELIAADPSHPTLDGVTKFSITDFYIAVCNRFPIHGFEPESAYRWVDIGKAETLDLAQNMWQ